jgi:hypothetical protein
LDVLDLFDRSGDRRIGRAERRAVDHHYFVAVTPWFGREFLEPGEATADLRGRCRTYE